MFLGYRVKPSMTDVENFVNYRAEHSRLASVTLVYKHLFVMNIIG